MVLPRFEISRVRVAKRDAETGLVQVTMWYKIAGRKGVATKFVAEPGNTVEEMIGEITDKWLATQVDGSGLPF
jgi:hypothetical protein